jgi:hypothetical protein
MSRWCGALGSNVEIQFASAETVDVPPIAFFRHKLDDVKEDLFSFPFNVRAPGGTGRGTLTLQRPGEKSTSSTFELRFSVNAKSKGLFTTGEQARHALVSAAIAFAATAGQVEADDFSDEESSRKYAIFQTLRDRRVPVSFEWVTVLRTADFRAVGWDLASISSAPGVRSGEEGGYVWIVLSDAPFSYQSNVGTEAQRLVETKLELRAKQ